MTLDSIVGEHLFFWAVLNTLLIVVAILIKVYWVIPINAFGAAAAMLMHVRN